MNLQEESTYIYDVGNKDKLRLQILNDIYNPFSQKALLDIDVKNKKCVIDMACGQGEMTCWIAQQIASNGGVAVGIDISEDQLDLAKKLAINKGISNVIFIKKSILDADFNEIKAMLPADPDLIYCRWLLIHLETDKIILAMKALYNLLRSGGVMAHEEVTLKESFGHNIAPSFYQYVSIFTELATQLKINFDLGPELPGLFSEVGYSNCLTNVFKPQYMREQLKFFQIDLESAIPALEKFNITQKHEIDALIDSIQRDFDEGFDMTMTNYFVYGVK